MLSDISNPVWIVVIFVVLPPVVLWIKRRLRPARRTYSITVDCPHCGSVNGLERLRNYICADCHSSVILTKGRNSSEPSDDWETYVCNECGAANIMPLRECLNCHSPRPVPAGVSQDESS